MEKARQYFVEPAAFVKENLCYNDGLGITEEDGFLIDRRYILAAMGLLATHFPKAALTMMKKELEQHGYSE